MRLPIIGVNLDERFLTHRLRSTSIGGLAGALVTAGLFFYDLFARHLLRWDLFSIIATMAVVKIAVLTWYRFND